MLRIEKTKREWLVSEQDGVTICIGVENGEPGQAKIVGLRNEPIYTDIQKLRAIWDALHPLLEQVSAAQERTREQC